MTVTEPLDPDRFTRLYRRFSALHELSRDTDFLSLHAIGSGEDQRLRAIVDALADQAATLGLDRGRFTRLLRNHVAARAAMKKPTGKLYSYLNAEIAAARQAVGELPGGQDKALAFLREIVEDSSRMGETGYEAYVYLKDSVEQAHIERVALHWREQWLESRERRAEDPFGSEVFWVSLDFQEMPDLVAHFRFYETFGLGEFDLVFRDALSHVGESLLEHATALNPFDVRPAGGWNVRSAAFDLWLSSRVRTVRYELQDTMLLALRALVRRQNADGSWPSEVVSAAELADRRLTPSFVRDTYGTALACVVLLKLGCAGEHIQAAQRGVLWLLKQQRTDGGWDDNVVAPDRQNGDLLTTLLAMEAILRSNHPRAKLATDRAASWIYGQQADLGGWFEGRFPSPLLTVLVLEALDLREAARVELNAYLESARMFLMRARRLVGDGLEASAPLAVVAAHHGVEAFLYGLLTLPRINQSVWEKQGRTIGARAALRKLEEQLKNDGVLRRNEVIGGRNDLDRLFDFRDQIVHKAIRITEDDARSAAMTAMDFVREQSLRELSIDLLEGA